MLESVRAAEIPPLTEKGRLQSLLTQEGENFFKETKDFPQLPSEVDGLYHLVRGAVDRLLWLLRYSR